MKLTEQIISGIKAFFGMEPDATESEVHDVVTTAKPLAEIENGTAIADLQAQISALNTKVEGHESQLTELQASYDTLKTENETLQTTIEAHVATISEKDAAIEAKEAELVALQASSKTQIDSLAGQIAALKAGRTPEKKDEAPIHPAANQGSGNQTKAAALVDPQLRAILGLN